MSKKIAIETRLILSKSFPPGTAGLSFGRYHIKPIPSTLPSETEAILAFEDTYEGPAGGSNPEGEATVVCNLLSVVLECRIRRHSLRLDSIDIPESQPTIYQRYRGNIKPEPIESYLQRTLHLPIDLARQLSRACRAYTSAIEYIPSDPTFAFFLLVVAIECLSSQAAVIAGKKLNIIGKCERFCTFIDRYLPDDGRRGNQRDQTLFLKLLKTVYNSHRSAFVHGGKEVSVAALVADRLGSNYFKHETDGPEVLTPGLDWFAHVVRGSIMGYLSAISLEATTPDEHLLAKLAFEKGILRLKAGKDFWRVATANDFFSP